MRVSLRTLKRGTVLFWALWLTVVTITNVFDLLKAIGVLPPEWSFASGNYGFVAETVAVNNVGGPLVTLLFIGVIIWEALAALLLWRAFLAYNTTPAGLQAVYTAFAVSLALWAAFMLADELFFAYDVEATHMRIFTAQLVTLLAIRLLPDDS